jgi:hypothetical protein
MSVLACDCYVIKISLHQEPLDLMNNCGTTVSLALEKLTTHCVPFQNPLFAYIPKLNLWDLRDSNLPLCLEP